MQKKNIQVTKLADVAKRAVWPAFVFNLSNEPAFKFNLCVFGDKSNDIQSRTSYFTQKQVIYIETPTDRYEICRKLEPDLKSLEDPEVQQTVMSQPQYMYTFSRVIDCHDKDNEFFSLESTKVPLEKKYKEIIAEDLDWQDFLWSDNHLRVINTIPVDLKGSPTEKDMAKKEKEKDGENAFDATEPMNAEEKTIGIYGPLINFKLYDIKNMEGV